MVKIQVIEKLFLNIVYFSYLILPLSFLIFKSKRGDIIPVTIAAYGIVFFCLLQLYQFLPKETKSFYQGFYTFFEYSVLSFFFWKNINSKKVKHFIFITSILFLVFQIIYVSIIKVKRLDSIPIGIETILLLIYILYFFYQFSKDLGTSYIYNHYAFWIAVGILIYLGGSFFFFILIDYLNTDEVEVFGNMTFVAEIIKNILFATGIYIYSKYPFKNKPEKQESIPFLDHI